MKLNKSLNLFSDITQVPDILNQKHYSSLNGIRALAVLLVVISHIMLQYGNFPGIHFMGYLGVNIFFVLSGFLITTLCIKEKIYSGNLSLKNFYIRRALRILPVAYLYILVVVILNALFKLGISKGNVLASALFAADFSHFRQTHFDWDLGHFWSLAVEEQFYILFPVLLKNSFKTFLWLILFILIALPLIIYLQSVNLLYSQGLAYALPHFLIRFQSISLGCLFSVLVFKGSLNWGRWKSAISITSLILIFIIKYDATGDVKAILINLLVAVLTGFVIVNSIYKTNDLLFKFFNLKIIALVGTLSYSIYIWQQLFVSPDKLFPISVFPYNMVFVLVVPCLSYFYYEKFFLKLKSKFAKAR